MWLATGISESCDDSGEYSEKGYLTAASCLSALHVSDVVFTKLVNEEIKDDSIRALRRLNLTSMKENELTPRRGSKHD